jgi:hypothetical protein
MKHINQILTIVMVTSLTSTLMAMDNPKTKTAKYELWSGKLYITETETKTKNKENKQQEQEMGKKVLNVKYAITQDTKKKPKKNKLFHTLTCNVFCSNNLKDKKD